MEADGWMDGWMHGCMDAFGKMEGQVWMGPYLEATTEYCIYSSILPRDGYLEVPDVGCTVGRI